jgi:tol-pal system protein YbgF
MSINKRTALALGLLLILAMSAPGGGAQKDKDVYAQFKVAFDELKNEVVVLERQVRSLQESQDRNSGQMSTLITQIIDNVTAIRQAQSRVAEGSNSAFSQINGIDERISSVNQRIDRLSSQMAELKKLVENLPKLPTFTEITPGNPDQLFAAAYGDYSRGNYDLAISEFRQYVETYPSTEMADNAQYWIGECFLAKKQFNEAIAEFDLVKTKYPKGDKVPAARLKKGMALMESGQPDAAKVEFKAIIALYKGSSEAAIAQQQLGEK